ncbi:MAG: xanthine dehydrogenase family protein subunit M [Anaerolineaceae bacterium]|nr:xanthine dehydrogenase family protein subunit M [Anaerolineaceae bacterium]
MRVAFDMLTPATLQDALDMLEKDGENITPVAGGTNLIVDCQSGRHEPKTVMNVHYLPELSQIEQKGDMIQIGGGVTLRAIEQSALMKEKSNALYRAAIQFANPLIRNRATVGGNLCDASPASDTAIPLLALGAEVELTSSSASRWVALDKFFVHVRKTARNSDELLTAVRWPVPVSGSANTFYKLGLRKADAISVVSLAVYVALDSDGLICEARIALGSVAPTPLRAYDAETLLKGKKPSEALYEEAGKAAMQACTPISDVRATAAYRREMVDVLVKRLLRETVKQISG